MKFLAFYLFALLWTTSAYAQRPPDGSNISYGAHESEKLDYWKAPAPDAPILFLIHGGGWRSGDKRSINWRNVAQLFTGQGYAVVNINYILSTDSMYSGFPMQPKNVACALAWTKENLQILNGDTSKIVLFGNSAGAHLASLHGLSQSSLLLDNCNYSASLDVLGVVALSGMFDFDLAPQENKNSLQAIRDMVGDSAQYWAQAQPIENTHKTTDTKFLLLHGTDDRTVGNDQAFAFADALREHGFPYELTILQDRKHDLLKFIDLPEDPVRIRVVNYLDSLFAGYKTDIPTSLENGDYLANQIEVYPNPVKNHVMIKIPNRYKLDMISIYNAIGGKVDELKNSQSKVNLSELNPGIYFIHLHLNNGYKVQKKIIKF